MLGSNGVVGAEGALFAGLVTVSCSEFGLDSDLVSGWVVVVVMGGWYHSFVRIVSRIGGSLICWGDAASE